MNSREGGCEEGQLLLRNPQGQRPTFLRSLGVNRRITEQENFKRSIKESETNKQKKEEKNAAQKFLKKENLAMKEGTALYGGISWPIGRSCVALEWSGRPGGGRCGRSQSGSISSLQCTARSGTS